MVVVKIGDGLGNQLYNYACGYAVAKKANEQLRLDTSECDNSDLRDYMLDFFKIDAYERESFPNKTVIQKIYKRVRRDLKYHVIKENPKSYSIFDERIFKKPLFRNRYLHGYWQNIRYFEMYEEEIRRQFTPKYEQSTEVLNLIEYLSKTNTCAIHFRGQDIAMPEYEYFQKAVSIMQQEKEGCEFFVFTNDKKQAVARLDRLDIKYKLVSDIGDFSDIDEFFLISACQNQIISNSTFSRWAAILNGNKSKVVIAPSHKKNSEEYPEKWVII